MAASVDIEAELVAYLGGRGFRVSAVLGPRFDDELPAVSVVALPGQELARAWNGPRLLEQIDVDCDVFGSDDEQAADTAAALQVALEAGAIELGLTRAASFSRRPDWNDKVRRRGAVLSFVTK